MPNMIETPQQTKSAEPTPEQLLQLLDRQINSRRAKRNGVRKHRAVLLVGGLFLILGALFVALFVLQQMVSDFRQPKPEQASELSVGNSQ